MSNDYFEVKEIRSKVIAV